MNYLSSSQRVQPEGIKVGMPYLLRLPFTRKRCDLVYAPGRSSGLFPVYCLPIPPKAAQWRSVNLLLITLCDKHETHSYGDSAGISPDFPFNPSHSSRDRGPDATNVMESLERRRDFYFFTFAVKLTLIPIKKLAVGAAL